MTSATKSKGILEKNEFRTNASSSLCAGWKTPPSTRADERGHHAHIHSALIFRFGSKDSTGIPENHIITKSFDFPSSMLGAKR